MNKENPDSSKVRYDYLDTLRGITLISMIAYHFVWDLVYIAGIDWNWFRSGFAYVWQQSICWTFILLSGFCWALGRRRLKRGLLVLGAGILTSLVTWIFTYDERITFGVLTFLGVAALLLIPLDWILIKVPAGIGTFLCIFLFFLTKGVNEGYLGMGAVRVAGLPENWYEKGYAMTFLGFTDTGFYSADYFSLFPWIFLFLTGYFLYKLACRKDILNLISMKIPPMPFSAIGRHSLLIYLLHQPMIYFGLMIVVGKGGSL